MVRVRQTGRLDAGPARERFLDRPRVETVLEDEQDAGRRRAHPRPPNPCSTATGGTPRSSVSRVTICGFAARAPTLGRRASQTFPLSDAKAISTASRSFTFRLT